MKEHDMERLQAENAALRAALRQAEQGLCCGISYIPNDQADHKLVCVILDSVQAALRGGKGEV